MGSRLRLLLVLGALALGLHADGSRGYRQLHLDLHVRPDFAAGRLDVRERLTLTPTRRLKALVLDCSGPRLLSARVGGAPLHFATQSGKLTLQRSRPWRRGGRYTVALRYSVVPQGGAVFYPAGSDRPRRQWLWVADEPRSARLWLPIDDRPADKLTFDLWITAPAGLQVIANGALVRRQTLAGGATIFHWRQATPLSPYLLTFYVGRWTTVADHAGGLPLLYATTPDESAAVARARFGATPAMIAFFQERTGVAFPWPKYAEVRNPGFFASLENASATEFAGNFPTNETVADLRARFPRLSVTIAHELAHQWFGDLVTCRDWSQLWVNEGLATFMQQQWDAYANGEDQALLDWETLARDYRRSPQAPIVRRVGDPWALFDAATYDKAAWAIRTLEYQLGPQVFWKGIHLYLQGHRFSTGDTSSFEQAMAKASGKDLRPWFHLWFDQPGEPSWTVRWSWDAAARTARIDLHQARGPVYRGTIDVAVWIDGRRLDRTMNLTKAQERWSLSLPDKPELVMVDPDHHWLRQIHELRTPAEWQAASVASTHAVDRIAALRPALAALPVGQRSGWLARRVEVDPSPALQDAALRLLFKINPRQAAPVALARLQSPNAGARQTAAELLGGGPATATGAALARLFRNDPVGAVRAAALQSLLRLEPTSAKSLADTALAMHSPGNQVEQVALAALSDRRGALPLLLQWSAPSVAPSARAVALKGLAVWALRPGRAPQARLLAHPEILTRLREALHNGLGTVQIEAAFSLAKLHDRASLPAIQALAKGDWVGFFRPAFAAAARAY